jgi:signal peptidase II
MSWAYTLILGGAIGNLIDRIRLDYVVDFIAVYSRKHTFFGIELPEWHFAIFNIADSAISIAAIFIIIDFFISKKTISDEVKS